MMRFVLAAFYIAAGIAHLLVPDKLLAITPAWVPFATQLILITGVCEIAGAIALVTEPLRWWAGVALALYALCVWPANIKHALEGIDLSPDMVAQLRTKTGGGDIPVTIGDFSEVAVSGSYRLIYVVYNTFFNLLHQEEQVRCFENVAAHLADDGSFVIEARVPGHVNGLRENQYVDAEEVGVDEVWLDVAKYDPVSQRLEETHVCLRAGGVGLFPIVTRYCYPSELDLMARIAGLGLKERWGGWRREPFDSRSILAVSVYGR